MGVFSVYTGIICNIFSKSLNIFGSAWRIEEAELNGTELETLMLPENASCYRGNPYPFGFDPIWQITENQVTYQNAFKMKLSGCCSASVRRQCSAWPSPCSTTCEWSRRQVGDCGIVDRGLCCWVDMLNDRFPWCKR